KLHNIHKYYSTGEQRLHVLKGIDQHIREGELVSIMGSSGSGKSTLLNILGILDTHDEGDYFLNGVAIRRLKEKKRRSCAINCWALYFSHSTCCHLRTRLKTWRCHFTTRMSAVKNATIVRLNILRWSAWAIVPITCPTNYPADRNSGWPSRGRW